MKIHPVGAKLIRADGRMDTDIHVKANRCFLQHANMPKKEGERWEDWE
jgi:hypothetical protein